MKKLQILGIVIFLFVLNSAPSYAEILVNSPSPQLVILSKDSPSVTISIVNTNISSLVNVYLSLSSSISSIVKLSSYSIDVSSDSNSIIFAGLKDDLTAGDYVGSITYSSLEGGGSIPVYVNIEESQQQSICNLDIFPIILTNIKIQQGEVKTRNIQLSIPYCYNSSVNVNGVALSTDEKPIQLGEISVGTIQPGRSIMIPIEINAQGVSTGQYSDILQLLLYDMYGNRIDLPQVSVSVLVSQGIQPITNFSLNDLPVCSIDAIEMNLNNTYKIICSRNNPNIEIRPIIDSKYIKGISVSETSSQYIFEFQPIELGKSFVYAEFWYKNAPLGTPFEQEVRISASGQSIVSGISLVINFYQSGIKKDTGNLDAIETIILVMDEQTNNTIMDNRIFLNGMEVNRTFLLEASKDYELIVSSEGYLTKTLNFSTSKSYLVMIIDPLKDEYNVGETIIINSTPDDAIILLNNILITSPYIFNSEGEFFLELKKDGFDTLNKTLIVRKIILFTPEKGVQEWGVGDTIKGKLSETSNWSIYFYVFEKYGDQKIISSIPQIINSGLSDNLVFKIANEGRYVITANDKPVVDITLKKSGWFGWLSWKGIQDNWIWYLIIIVVIIIIYFLFFKNRGRDSTSEELPFSSKINLGE